MAVWFVEEPDFASRWRPKTYHQDRPPEEKRPAGGKRTFRAEPVLVPDHLEKLTLDQLAEIFGVDGKLRATGLDVAKVTG